MRQHFWVYALGMLAGVSLAAQAPAATKIETLCEGNPALAVMTSDLLQARLAVKEGKAAQAAIRQHAPHAIRDGKLQCIIGATTITDELLQACAAARLELVGTYTFPGLSQVVVRCSNPAQLDTLARRSDVRVILSEPAATTWVGSVDNQADASIKAASARAIYSVTGSGIRLGVLSDSIHRVIGGNLSGTPGFLTNSSSQVSGDLPASIRVLDPGPNTGNESDEGAAMSELIYDLVPGCDLSFASAFTNYAAFASNITSLVTDAGYECDVIVDDVLYFGEPMYQNGPIAIAANNAYAAGVPYFSSAGNQGDDGHERPYFDVNPGVNDATSPPTGNDLHDFGAAYGLASDTHLQVDLQADSVLTVVLHWDQPYGGGLAAGPGSEVDLDLFLTSDTAIPLNPGNILASGTTIQGTTAAPAGDAYEWFQYQSPGDQTAYIVVDHYDGLEPVILHVWVSLQGGGTIADKALLADRTIYGHAAAENVMAVAAMFYGEIDTGGAVTPPSGELNVEPFSSLGGNLPFWFDDLGALLPGAPVARFKPETTGPDGTNTTFFGSDIGYDADLDPNFFGTSAAAPHVAAVAALMLDASGALTPAQVYNGLRSKATDAETPGVDFWSGDGVADASASVGFAAGATPVRGWEQY